MRLHKVQFKYDFCEHCFKTKRVVNIWNSLPNWVVTNLQLRVLKHLKQESIHSRNFWQNLDIMYDFHAQVEGTGSQIEI